MNVKLFKLVSGEEIISEASLEGTDYTLKNAVVLVFQQMGGGQVSTNFAPFMPYSKGTITLQGNAVIAISDVKDELLTEYNRIFSNIIVASSPILR